MKIILICFFLILSLNAFDDLGTIEVSTGTKTSKILENTPVQTEVVSSKDIKLNHAKNISEALENVPGIMIKRTHGKQGLSVWMQGFDSDRVLVLINGEALTSSTGTTVDLSQISTEDVAKIEIIKGASSALYGSGALGGVINIITKKAKNGVHSSVGIEAGTAGSRSANFGSGLLKAKTAYKNKNYALDISAVYAYDGGTKLSKGYTYDLPLSNRLNFDTKYTHFGIWQLSLAPSVYLEDTYEPFYSGIKEKKNESAQKYRLGFDAIRQFSSSKLKIFTFWEHYDDVTKEDKLMTSFLDELREAHIDLANASVQYDLSIAANHLLSLGTNLTFEKMKQTKIAQNISVDELGNNAKRTNAQVYLQDDWFAYKSLEVLPGLRYQYDDGFGSYVSPKLIFYFKKDFNAKHRLNIRLSFGNGYKVPSLKERYFHFDHSIYGYEVLGNPDLKPESSISYNLSFEFLKNSDYTLALNFYDNEIKDLIDTQKDPKKSAEAGLDIYTYQNISKAFTRGFELELEKNFLRYFSIKGGYTYLYAKDKLTNEFLSSRPKNQVKVSLGASYFHYHALVSVNAQDKEYVSAQEADNLDIKSQATSPGFVNIDISLSKDFTKKLSTYVKVENLLDVHQNPNNENDLRDKTPRYFSLGLSYKF